MAAVKIPAWPRGVAGNVWANQLARASLYAIESDIINFDTGTSINIFSIPEQTVLWAIGLEIVTAFNAGGSKSIVVKDTSENLAIFGDVIGAAGAVEQLVLKRYAGGSAGVPGVTSRSIQVDVNAGGGTTGVGRVWLVLKPQRSSFRRDNV